MELESWADVLARWTSTKQRPRQLAALVHGGIPEALRGEVWQRLAGCENDTAMMDTYRILITKVCLLLRIIVLDLIKARSVFRYTTFL
jgi:hypothetical protein